MRIINCFWEQENLGKKVVEIVVEKDDTYSAKEISEAIKDYEYACIKVPVNKLDYNFGLAQQNFTLVECQYRISKLFKNFDFSDKKIKWIIPHLSIKKVEDESIFLEILSKMTPDMFSTDRIVLDPHFKPTDGLKRYQNWMRTEFYNHKARFFASYFDNELVGFGMSRKQGDIIDGLLGGIFKEYHSLGIGVLTCSTAFLYARQENQPFLKLMTSISSNNTPVVQLYNYLGFKIVNTSYVFVKHTNIHK